MRVSIYMLIGLMLLAPAVASAQTYQGGVRGAVRDAEGGVLPGATVTLTNEATNVTRSTVTNDVGEYVFAGVAPGTYTLQAELAGFAPYRREGLEVGVQTFLVQDATLQVGGIEETITVTGETPLIETATASIASALDKAQMEVLPTPGRNIYIMAVTTPNVAHAGDPVFVRMQDQTNASLLSLGGGPMRSNNYTLDGVSIVDIRNRSSINPSFEALEEMKVQISTYDAEMGRTSAGVFNAIHRGGSNNWGGSALYQSRPHFGRSQTFFEERDGVEPPEAPYDLWGGSFGGPVARDRTFFWWSHEGYKNIDTRNDVVFLPTRAMANGDFSALGFPIYDPLTGQPFPGNQIPEHRRDPVGVAMANQLADIQERVGSQEASATALLDNIAWQMSGNVNHSFSDTWQLSGTFMYYESEEPDNKYYTDLLDETPVFDTGSAILFRDVQVLAINSTHIPSDESVLTLRYGYARFNDSPANPEFTAQDAIGLGFNADQMNAIGAGIQQFPYITADGYGVNDSTHGSWDSGDIVFKSQEASGVYSRFVGSHTLKFGAQYRQLGVDWFRTAAMNFNFPARFTAGPGSAGDGIATMVLGLPDEGAAEVSVPIKNFLNYYAGFVQDDWRMSENFVLNLGLRLEHETGFGERDNQIIYGWEYDEPFPISAPGMNLSGGILYAGVDGNPERTHDPPALKVGPRAGFAYSVNTDTVLRGGYGVFWAPRQYAGPSVTNNAALGFAAQTNYISFENGGTGTLSNPFPDGVNQPAGSSNRRLQNVGETVNLFDQFGKSGYIQKWSIDLQRELGGNVAMKIGYVGSKGSNLPVSGTDGARTNINQLAPEHLALGNALNEEVANPFFGIDELGPISASPTIRQGQLLRPFPQFLDVLAFYRSTSRSRYDSIRLELEKRFRGVWGARINYTWANQRDNIYDTAITPTQDETNVVYRTGFEDLDFGPARVSIPHQFNVNGLYRFPSPGGGAAGVILGGWSASVSAILRDGFPVLIRQNNNWGAAFGYNHQRPNATGTDPVSSGSTADRVDNYINPAAYEQVGDFQFGNAPHTNGDLRTPWLYNWDVAFEKSTNVGADAHLTLRFEWINFLNQPNWRGPRSIVGQSVFGRITGQLGFPRTFQFMAKFTF